MNDFVGLVKKILYVLLAIWVAFIIFKIIQVGISVALGLALKLLPILILLVGLYIVVTVVGKKKK